MLLRDINPVFMLSSENLSRYGCILITWRNIRVKATKINLTLVQTNTFSVKIFKKGQMLLRDIYAFPSTF